MAATARESDVEATIIARLHALSPERQQEVLNFVEALSRADGYTSHGGQSDDALIARYIDTVHVDRDHPSYARLADYGTPVWSVIGAWKATGNVDEVAKDWGVPIDYVHGALAYYRRFRRYIDALLILNESEPHEPAPQRP